MNKRLLPITLGLLALQPACYIFERDSCVAEGAWVSTPDGPRLIESLRIGDVVWAVDPATGERSPTRITAIKSAVRECLALQLGAAGSLVCTPDHPVYAPEVGTYLPAVCFLEGRVRQVLRVDDHGARVETVELVRADVGLRRVFDLTVDSEHHDFVADGVLVHNKSEGCYFDPPEDRPWLACDPDGYGTTDDGSGETTDGGWSTDTSGDGSTSGSDGATDSSSDGSSSDDGSSSGDGGSSGDGSSSGSDGSSGDSGSTGGGGADSLDG